MNEIWKDTYIYGQQYQISNYGRVRNKFSGHILTPQIDNKGYLRVRMSFHDKKATAKVHRLVAMAFIPNPENKPQVNHIDTDKKNNCVDNLEWVTNGENQIHAFETGLNYVTGKAGRKRICVSKIDLMTGTVLETYPSIAKAAEKNKVYETNIRKVTLGERKSAGGFGWRVESEVVPYAETVNY